MPEFQTFLTGSNLTIFWENVRWVMFFVSPIVLIFVAPYFIGKLIKLTKNAFKDDDDNDDDYEVYRY